ncbi:MAG: hypothetical protein AAF288_06455 [Planctomycetota bacterium]
MTKTELRSVLRAVPFEPFVVVSASGDRYSVTHRDFALLSAGASLHVYRGGPEAGSEPELFAMISLPHIASIEPLPAGQPVQPVGDTS